MLLLLLLLFFNENHEPKRSSSHKAILIWVDQLFLLDFFSISVSGDGCSLILKPARVVVGFGEPVLVTCEATRPVRVLGWESAISAAHTQQGPSVQWKVDSLIDWIEEPICYGVFFTAPRQCEEKLNLVLYSEITIWQRVLLITWLQRPVFCLVVF